MTSVPPIDNDQDFQGESPGAADKVVSATLDSQFTTTKNKLNELIGALSRLIRDDDTLLDAVVRARNLHPEITTLLGITTGWQPRISVACATTANITLTGEQTIDGVLTSGSRVLVKNQTTASENGIYVSAGGAWSRATDCDTAAELGRAITYVTSGSTLAGTSWVLVQAITDITLGTTSLSWSQTGSSALSITATGSTQQRSLADRFGEVFNIKDYGAKYDLTTDDAPAIQRAIDAAAVVNGFVYMPSGSLRVASTITPAANVRIGGAGLDQTKLVWADSADLFYRAPSAQISGFELEDFSIIGDWNTTKDDNGHYPIRLYNIDYLFIRRVGVDYSRKMSIALRKCNVVAVESCRVRWSARDGISAGTCSYVSITHNAIYHGDDDAIVANSQADESAPVRHNIVIANNRIVDAQGIRVDGAKVATITGNTIERCRAYGIVVTYDLAGGSTATGVTPILGLVIANNVITDVINRNGIDGLNSSKSYIQIASAPVLAGGLTTAPTKGSTADATGKTVTSPYPYFYNNGLAVPTTGGHFIVVSGNVCARTLPTVAAYSTWGFGQMFTRTGWVDPAITETEMSSGFFGLSFLGSVRAARVIGNHFNGQDNGVLFSATGAASEGYQGVVVAENTFTDNLTGAVVFAGGVTGTQDVKILGNQIDCDPYVRSPNRGNNGTWANASSPCAFFLQSAVGVEISGNTVKNVSQVINGGPASFVANNVVRCKPAARGYSASNAGIGNCPPPGIGYTYVVCDSDPASATWGEVLNACVTEASAMPSTGTYVNGHFVKNTAPTEAGTAASKYTVDGWRRVTLGSNHVLNTDWLEVRTLTGN